MLRAVVDVNVLVSALLQTEGPPARIVDSWAAGSFELIVSPLLLQELRRVTARNALARRLAPHAVEELVATLQVDAVVIDDPVAERIVPDDPKDDYLVALARAGTAHVIVTGDRHLLDLDGLQPQAVAPRTFLGLLERFA